MRTTIVAILVALISTQVFAVEAPNTEEQKTIYAIGLIISRQLSAFNLSADELEFVKQGMDDIISGRRPAVELSAYNGKVQELARARRKIQGEKNAAMNREFIEKAAKEKGAIKTASGLVYIPLQEGSGASPEMADTVKVNYRGTLIDGREFDSSYKRRTPTEFRLDGVIKCWTEGVQKLKVGGKARLVCPAALAYGDAGAGDLILPGSTLNFEIELLEVLKK